MPKLIIALLALLAMTGCDQVSQKLGMEDPAKKEARLVSDAIKEWEHEEVDIRHEAAKAT